MKGQKVVLVGAFVIAAVVSPTADPTNQVLLALPMILMYQVGVVWVYWVNRRARLAGRAQPVYRGARQEARDTRDEDMSEITAIAQSRAVVTRPRPQASLVSKSPVGGVAKPRQSNSVRVQKLVKRATKPTQDMLTIHNPAVGSHKKPQTGTISGVVVPSNRSNRGNLNSVHDLQPAPGRRGRSLDGF